MNLREEYRVRYSELLLPFAEKLQKKLEEELSGLSRVDSIRVRAKKIDSFIKKANQIKTDEKKYEYPLAQIQDQLGARVIVFFMEDVEKIEKEILKYYTFIEKQSIVPDTDESLRMSQI